MMTEMATVKKQKYQLLYTYILMNCKLITFLFV